jgi:hypothetical protein
LDEKGDIIRRFQKIILKKGLLREWVKILSEETSISSTVIYLKRQSYKE